MNHPQAQTLTPDQLATVAGGTPPAPQPPAPPPTAPKAPARGKGPGRHAN
jgi:hypothetical protein